MYNVLLTMRDAYANDRELDRVESMCVCVSILCVCVCGP